MAERFSCRRACLSRGEPLLGTASQVHRWILVEQPGSWGRDAPVDSNLPDSVGRELLRRAGEVRARLVLVRRYGRPGADERSCFVVDSTADRTEQITFEDPHTLLDIDLSPLAERAPVGGEPVDGHLWLTCTNGSHDVCCAEFGRPVAAALDGHRPRSAWECSHIGGDRFAANVVVLPEGIYLGRMDPTSTPDVVEEIEAGRLPLAHYRGRSTARFAAQAAELLARRALDAGGIDDLLTVEHRRTGDHETETVLAGAIGRYVATVLTERAPPARLTCHSDQASRPPRYHLVSLDPV